MSMANRKGSNVSQVGRAEPPDHQAMLTKLSKTDWEEIKLPYYSFAGPDICYVEDFALSLTTVIGDKQYKWDLRGELLEVHFIPDLDLQDFPTRREFIDCIVASSSQIFSMNDSSNVDKNSSIQRIIRRVKAEFAPFDRYADHEYEFIQQLRNTAIIFDNLVIVDDDIDFLVVSSMLEEFDFVIRQYEKRFEVFMAIRDSKGGEMPLEIEVFREVLQAKLNTNRVSPIPAIDPEKISAVTGKVIEGLEESLENKDQAPLKEGDIKTDIETKKKLELVKPEDNVSENGASHHSIPITEKNTLPPVSDRGLDDINLPDIPKKHRRRNPPVIAIYAENESLIRREIDCIYGENMVEYDGGIATIPSEYEVGVPILRGVLERAFSEYSKRLDETRVVAISDLAIWEYAKEYLKQSKERFGIFEQLEGDEKKGFRPKKLG